MYVYAATIGRNIPTSEVNELTGVRYAEPMSDETWAAFIEDVSRDMSQALDLARYGQLEISHGRGSWEGIEEENATITVRRNHDADDEELRVLRRYLSENARHYGQDAIALTIGRSELV